MLFRIVILFLRSTITEYNVLYDAELLALLLPLYIHLDDREKLYRYLDMW